MSHACMGEYRYQCTSSGSPPSQTRFVPFQNMYPLVVFLASDVLRQALGELLEHLRGQCVWQGISYGGHWRVGRTTLFSSAGPPAMGFLHIYMQSRKG